MYGEKLFEGKKKRWSLFAIAVALFITALPINQILAKADEKIIRVGYDTNSNFIKNDGKGTATITLGSETKKVEAKALEAPSKLPKLKMVPAIPTIEVNTIKITLDAGVLFDVDKYNIRKDAQKVLNDLASILKKADIKSFQIDGHTDSDASEEHNQTLSENRANSVKKYLASQGVTATISTKGYGESKPVATNKTAEGKQKNRRVEILIPTT